MNSIPQVHKQRNSHRNQQTTENRQSNEAIKSLYRQDVHHIPKGAPWKCNAYYHGN